MTYITVKTKKTNANVEINPPIVLDERCHISLVDIKIPEEVIKNFTLTEEQTISSDPSNGLPGIIPFPKGVYNIYKLRDIIANNLLMEWINLIININDNNVYISTKSEIIKVSAGLARVLNIPRTLPPFSFIKISGGERYLVYCDLVENKSSYSFETKVSPSRLLAVAPSQNGRYPELLVQSGNNTVINNLTLEILTEDSKTSPDFDNKEIIYVLKIW